MYVIRKASSKPKIYETYRMQEVRKKVEPVPQPMPKVEHTPKVLVRIEHPESGKGPYTHDSGRGLFASDAMNYIAEPSEFKVPALGIGSPYRYAFIDSMKLMSAVRSLVLLREYGFNIVALESNQHIVLPDGQVAFIREKSRVLESHPIHEFPYEDYVGEEE